MECTHARRISIAAVFALGSLVIHTGCSKSDAGGSASAASASSIPGTGDPAAANAVQAEFEKHWIKTPDGWFTDLTLPNPYVETVHFRQIKDLKGLEVESQPISEADKLNGIEFNGEIGKLRFVYRDGLWSHGASPRWHEWQDGHTIMYVQKKGGQWHVDGGNLDGIGFFSGTKPSESSLPKLQ